MAKLHAHGRRELARVERLQRTDTELVLWTRHTRVLMDDGVVLNKMDTKWKGSPDVEYGRWRVSGQLGRTDRKAWVAQQARAGYKPGHLRHAAALTEATLTDAEIVKGRRR